MKESFTYEVNDKKQLETYEWDNIWWEHADDEKADRVLIVGDSISCGYRGFVNEIFDKKVFADGIGTSKNLGNDSLIKLVDYVFYQQKNYRLIQFNNGLHGWNLQDKEYEYYYEKIVNHIQDSFQNLTLVLALTTPVRCSGNIEKLDGRNDTVIKRNETAIKIANKYDLVINDLYGIIKDNKDIYKSDGVHLNDEGYKMLAGQCVNIFKANL